MALKVKVGVKSLTINELLEKLDLTGLQQALKDNESMQLSMVSTGVALLNEDMELVKTAPVSQTQMATLKGPPDPPMLFKKALAIGILNMVEPCAGSISTQEVIAKAKKYYGEGKTVVFVKPETSHATVPAHSHAFDMDAITGDTKANPDTGHKDVSLADIAAAMNLMSSEPTDAEIKEWVGQINQTPVKALADAEVMYQRVLGTSPGTIYRLIAKSKNVKIGIKMSSAEMAFRAEGSGIQAVASALTKQGFEVKEKSGGGLYASMHLGCSDKNLQLKCIGAVLMGLEIQWFTALPDQKIMSQLAWS